jgi:hypothetical protein
MLNQNANNFGGLSLRSNIFFIIALPGCCWLCVRRRQPPHNPYYVPAMLRQPQWVTFNQLG